MRTLTGATQTAIASGAIGAVLLLQMDYSPVVRLCSANHTLSWGGFDWSGAGSLGAVEPVKDATGEVQALRFQLSGVPSSSIALVFNQSARNRACTLRLALLDSNTRQILDAVLLGSFVLDQTTVTEANGQATIGVTALHMASVFRRVKPSRYTSADQKRLYPGDESLEYIVSQSTHADVWPAAAWFRK